MNILEALFLFLAIWWSLVNVSKLIYREPIPVWNFILQTIGIVGVIFFK